jgi:hypothetical protein
VAIVIFEWVAQLGLIGALTALLWTDSRVSSRALRIAATAFLALTLLSWWTPSILWALLSGERTDPNSFLPRPWSIVSIYSHNAAHWFAFFAATAWLVAAQSRRRSNGA